MQTLSTRHQRPWSNQTTSLNRGTQVLLSVTPSRNVDIQVAWGSLSISGVKSPWASSLTSSSKRYCTLNVVSHDCVSMCTKKDYELRCPWLEPTVPCPSDKIVCPFQKNLSPPQDPVHEHVVQFREDVSSRPLMGLEWLHILQPT